MVFALARLALQFFPCAESMFACCPQKNGRVAIYPSARGNKDPTFSSFDECMEHYFSEGVSVTGLAAKPTGCIAIPTRLKAVAVAASSEA